MPGLDPLGAPHQDPQRVVAAALRAQARLSGQPGPAPGWQPAAPSRRGLRPMWVLLIALLVGVLLGVGLALVSLLAPEILPTIR